LGPLTDDESQYDTEPYVVAVKAFRKGGKNVAVDVKTEVNALAQLNQLGEEHIVRFITSFQRGTQEDLEYYVLFEWADGGNLNDFWHQPHKPRRTASLVKWVVEQLCGLTRALKAAHYMPKELIHRHGDLKPGNILWFPNSDGYGTLKIGEWGEAMNYNQLTALRHVRYGTRRYEPPETGLQTFLAMGAPQSVSRLYDVWGMGCIILEFIIWLLYDYEELCRFNSSNQGYFGPSDMFYEISPERAVRVHRVVEHWMEHMAKDELCRPGETALGDLLQIVRTGLLVVELPEYGGLAHAADTEMTFTTHGDNPLIRVTAPDSTTHGDNPSNRVIAPDSTNLEGFHGSASKQRTRLRADELETEMIRLAEGENSEHYWHQDQEPRPAPVDDTGLSRRPAPITKLYPRVDDTIDHPHPYSDPMRHLTRCMSIGCQNWAEAGEDQCFRCLDSRDDP